MTTTSFSTATPSSTSLRSQPSPPLSYRHLVRSPSLCTAQLLYSTRFRQNIFDFLLTLSSRARQSMNQMSESSEANYHANTLSLAFHTAFPSARRWKHQTTTSFHRSDHLPSQNLSCRAMTASRWKRTLMQKQRPRTAAKMPTRATRCVLFSS
jgi:hypothetical protein